MMLPLQDITNMINKNNTQSEDYLLEGEDVLFFSSPARTTTTATTTTPSSVPPTSPTFSHPIPSSPRQLFPQKQIFRSAFSNASIVLRRRSLPACCPSSSSSSGSSRVEFDTIPSLNIDMCEEETSDAYFVDVYHDAESQIDHVNYGYCATSQNDSCDFYPHSECNNNTTSDFLLKKSRKRISLPAIIDQSKLFKKLHPISKNELVDLVCDVSKISLKSTAGQNKEKTCNTNLINRLQTLLKNIHKALPDRVFGQTCDAVSFKRIEVHLLLFKQECLRQCRSLYENARWEELVDYIVQSCQLVQRLPNWQNTSHNLHREQLFRIMATYIRKSGKLANFSQEFTINLKTRLSKSIKANHSITKVCQEL